MTTWQDVTIGICAMPERRQWVDEMLGRLHEECCGARIIVHEHERGTPPSVDFPRLVAKTQEGRRGEWTLLLEDDSYIPSGFGERALEALRAAPTPAISLFSRSKRDLKCLGAGASWRRQSPSSFYMSQALGARPEVLIGFAEWAPSWYAAHPKNVRAADRLFAAWLSKHRIGLSVHVPSLVQHRRGPSTLPGGRSSFRQSESYRMAFGTVPGEAR